MYLREQLTRSLTEVTLETLESLISVTPTVQSNDGFSRAPDKTDIIASIGIAGRLEGSLSLFFSKEASCRIVSKMLSTTITEMNQDVADGIGEIANILAGGLKTKIGGQGRDFEISIPMVVKGTDILSVPKEGEIDVAVLHVDCKEFTFKIALFFSIEVKQSKPTESKKDQEKSQAGDILKGFMQ